MAIKVIINCMISTLQQYNRVLDNKYGVVSVFNPDKDKNGLSVFIGRDLITHEEFAIKVMGPYLKEDFKREAASNELLPPASPWMVKAIETVV